MSTTTEAPTRRTMPPVDKATRAERDARAVATRQHNEQARKASAKPIGTADTIEEVLARSSGAITQSRRDVLKVLVDLGGHIAENSGRATTILMAEITKRTGKDYTSAAGLSGLLRDMEADQQIGRKMNAKRTFLITVVDPLREEFKGKTTPASGTSTDVVEREPVVDEAPGSATPPVSKPTPPLLPTAPRPDVPTDKPETVVDLTETRGPSFPGIKVPAGALAPSTNGNGSGPIVAPPAPSAEPAPSFTTRSATFSTTMSDDDLWDLLDVLLDTRTLPFSRESVTLFNQWCSATRAIIEKSIAR